MQTFLYIYTLHNHSPYIILIYINMFYDMSDYKGYVKNKER